MHTGPGQYASQGIITKGTVLFENPRCWVYVVHDRMPAILERGDIKNRINPNLSGKQRVAYLRNNPCASDNLKVTIHKVKEN